MVTGKRGRGRGRRGRDVADESWHPGIICSRRDSGSTADDSSFNSRSEKRTEYSRGDRPDVGRGPVCYGGFIYLRTPANVEESSGIQDRDLPVRWA